MKISWALIAAYVIFWLWYTPLGGPLTANEIDQYVATLEARNADKAAIKQLRAFAENDDGGSFIMVNALDLKDTLEPLSGMPADSAADDVMDVYVEHICYSLPRKRAAAANKKPSDSLFGTDQRTQVFMKST